MSSAEYTTVDANAKMECGSGISDTCKGATIPMNNAGWQQLTGEVVGAATFILKSFSLAAVSDPSVPKSQIKALNAARCAVTFLGDNAWNWLAALYYGMKTVGQEQEMVKLLDEYYPYVCTCNEEVDTFAVLLMVAESTITAYASIIFGACSEIAQETMAYQGKGNNFKAPKK